jgi:hypothetical protein
MGFPNMLIVSYTSIPCSNGCLVEMWIIFAFNKYKGFVK